MYSQQTRFKNKQRQRNIFESNQIQEFGISGDVAGIIINKMNSTAFDEITGNKNSSLLNALSVNEYSYSEQLDNDRNSINIIERAGNNFFISGNNTNEPDKSKIYSILNVSLILLYISKSITKYSDNMISKNMGNKDIYKKLDYKMKEIIKIVRKFMYEIDYRIEMDEKNNTFTIYVYEEFNTPISKINININEI